MLGKQNLLTSLSLLVIITFVGAAASAAADDVDVDREVSVSEEPDSFHAVSESAGFLVNDRFDVIFDEGTISLWYSEDASAVSSPSLELELTFERLIAFKDNGNGVFDSGDAVVSSADLGESTYALSYSTMPLPDGGNKTTVTAVTEDGLLVLRFVIATSPIEVGDIPLPPSSVKLDIDISPGVLIADGADHVGLAISIDADCGSNVQLEELDDSAELNVTKSALSSFFKWSTTALVDGVNLHVNASWSGDILTLSYPAGETISHDPVIGVRSVAPLSGIVGGVKLIGSPLLYGVGLAFATATVLGAVSLRRRKNH